MSDLSDRIRQIRVERFGESGATQLAAMLGLPVRTWLNYESGVTIPGEILLTFIVYVGVHPYWLLLGKGDPYTMDERTTHWASLGGRPDG